MKLAFYAGRLVEGDAISNSLRSKLDAIDLWQRDGAPVEPVVYAQDADHTFSCSRLVPGAPDLLCDSRLSEISLHLFEFGIYYSLFNALLALDRHAAIGVTYHNVTPIELVDDPTVKQAIARSMEQRCNIAFADHVACDSQVNLLDLLSIGISAERMTVVPLPSPVGTEFAEPRSHRTGPVKVLFVGRPVRSKGLLDLCAAVQTLSAESLSFEVDIIGRLDYADLAIVGRLNGLSNDERLLGRFRLRTDHPTHLMASAFEAADVLVMPSYHEGYCVPAVEALSAGCHVIAYDNSNLPYVTAGLAQLVATGSVGGLTDAMRTFIERLTVARETGAPFFVETSEGNFSEPQWREKASTYAGSLPHQFDAGLRTVVAHLANAVQPRTTAESRAVLALKDYLCTDQYLSS